MKNITVPISLDRDENAALNILKEGKLIKAGIKTPEVSDDETDRLRMKQKINNLLT
jgi:hypothetical protein